MKGQIKDGRASMKVEGKSDGKKRGKHLGERVAFDLFSLIFHQFGFPPISIPSLDLFDSRMSLWMLLEQQLCFNTDRSAETSNILNSSSYGDGNRVSI